MPFKPGLSGNPKGRPKGSLNKSSLLKKALISYSKVEGSDLSKEIDSLIKLTKSENDQTSDKAIARILEVLK